MRIAICQPTYLPWLGYFDLMDQVDSFVFLDNVQFAKQSWQQRNRIKTASGLQWLTVPAKFRGRFGQLIKDVEIREPDFSRFHLRAIELAYGRSRYFSEYFPQLSQTLEELRQGLLVDLNIGLIVWARKALGISTRVIRASELNTNGKRTELLAQICQQLGATEYVSPIGSAAYLISEQKILTDCGIKIYFHHYEHPEYRQLFPPFVPFASVIDAIFNYGPLALAIIQSGRRDLYSVEDAVELSVAEARKSSSVA